MIHENMMADLYTVTVNIVGLPSLSILGFGTSGLPIGMQLVGHVFGSTLLSLGQHIRKSRIGILNDLPSYEYLRTGHC